MQAALFLGEETRLQGSLGALFPLSLLLLFMHRTTLNSEHLLRFKKRKRSWTIQKVGSPYLETAFAGDESSPKRRMCQN